VRDVSYGLTTNSMAGCWRRRQPPLAIARGKLNARHTRHGPAGQAVHGAQTPGQHAVCRRSQGRLQRAQRAALGGRHAAPNPQPDYAISRSSQRAALSPVIVGGSVRDCRRDPPVAFPTLAMYRQHDYYQTRAKVLRPGRDHHVSTRSRYCSPVDRTADYLPPERATSNALGSLGQRTRQSTGSRNKAICTQGDTKSWVLWVTVFIAWGIIKI